MYTITRWVENCCAQAPRLGLSRIRPSESGHDDLSPPPTTPGDGKQKITPIFWRGGRDRTRPSARSRPALAFAAILEGAGARRAAPEPQWVTRGLVPPSASPQNRIQTDRDEAVKAVPARRESRIYTLGESLLQGAPEQLPARCRAGQLDMGGCCRCPTPFGPAARLTISRSLPGRSWKNHESRGAALHTRSPVSWPRSWRRLGAETTSWCPGCKWVPSRAGFRLHRRLGTSPAPEVNCSAACQDCRAAGKALRVRDAVRRPGRAPSK